MSAATDQTAVVSALSPTDRVVRIPEWWFADPSYQSSSHITRSVLGVMVRHMRWTNNSGFAGNARLAQESGTSTRSVVRAVAWGRRQGFLRCEYLWCGAGGWSRLYHIARSPTQRESYAALYLQEVIKSAMMKSTKCAKPLNEPTADTRIATKCANVESVQSSSTKCAQPGVDPTPSLAHITRVSNNKRKELPTTTPLPTPSPTAQAARPKDSPEISRHNSYGKALRSEFNTAVVTAKPLPDRRRSYEEIMAGAPPCGVV